MTRPQGSWQRGGGMPAKAFSRGTVRGPAAGSWQLRRRVPAKAFSRSANASAGPAPWAMARAARPCARRRGVPGSAAASCRVGRRAAPGALACGSMPARRGRCSCGWASARRRDGAIGGSVLGRPRPGPRRRAPGRCTPPGSGGPRGRAGRAPAAGQRAGRRAASSGRRRSLWRIFGKRSGGLQMIPASRRRLFVLYAVVGRAADHARRAAVVPAGHERPQLRAAGLPGPDADRDHARGPRPDPRRRGPAPGGQRQLAGGHGEHDEPGHPERRRRGGAAPGWPTCSACPTSCSPRRSGCAPRTCPSRAGPARRTSPSRWPSTSRTRSRSRSCRTTPGTPG